MAFLLSFCYREGRQTNTHFVITMETASFRTLSPNTSMLRVGLTSRAWKMARVATGSTAEIRAPNVKLGTGRRQQRDEVK